MTDTATTEPLTDRQRAVLEVIRTSVSDRGYPPSQREIGAAVGLSSNSSVTHQLRVLERKGYLRRDPTLPRAITITDTVEHACSVVCPACGKDSVLVQSLTRFVHVDGSANDDCWRGIGDES